MNDASTSTKGAVRVRREHWALRAAFPLAGAAIAWVAVGRPRIAIAPVAWFLVLIVLPALAGQWLRHELRKEWVGADPPGLDAWRWDRRALRPQNYTAAGQRLLDLAMLCEVAVMIAGVVWAYLFLIH